MTNRMGRADLHMHTRHSDGAPPVRALLDHVKLNTFLDVIAITDHDTISGALEACELKARFGYPFEIIVGEEVSTRQGHLVGLFLRECIPPGMGAADTVAAIHERGGLAFAPHPFFLAEQIEGKPITMEGLGRYVDELDLDGIETINSTPTLGPANRRAARHNDLVLHLPALGNSDAHILAAIGKGYTAFPGRTAADLRAAIHSRTTRARSKPYQVRELLAYLYFWVRRPKVPAAARSAALRSAS